MISGIFAAELWPLIGVDWYFYAHFKTFLYHLKHTFKGEMPFKMHKIIFFCGIKK